MSRAKHWCFTWNNPPAGLEQTLSELVPRQAEYLVYGREVGESGTPHLQGYVIWNAAVRLTTCKNRLGGNPHVEVARGSAFQNRNYCIKDGDFEEYGEAPRATQGRRSELDAFFEWTDEFGLENDRVPTTPEIARRFPTVLTRYRGCVNIARLRFEAGPLINDPDPQEWQQELYDELGEDADDRIVRFIVDEVGGAGKSWFQRWFWSENRAVTQVLGIGRRDDLAHAISESKSVFLFNVPRGQMEFLQYSVLEMMKDRVIFSPKYNSRTKELTKTPHVVVFCNEPPDTTKMTGDRYSVKYLSRSVPGVQRRLFDEESV